MADIYGNIPDVDSRGIPNQKAKFRQWNPDPFGNEAANLGKINPDLARVIAQARADNPNLRFVLGSGARTAQQQDLAQSWGWSPVGAKGGGDAAVHMRGNAADLWPVNGQGQIDFNPSQQQAVTAAIKAAADKLGVSLNAGADWKHPDAPHFELKGNPNWTPPSQSSGATTAQPASAPPGTTLNSSVIDTLAKNIAGIESGTAKDPYSVLGPETGKGRAVGKYQVMPFNVGPWTQQALGHAMTPEEFAASPSAQEAVFRDQMSRILATNSPADAASIWFTGKPVAQAGGKAADILGTTNASYVARATAGIPNAGTMAASTTPGTSINTTGSPTVAQGAPAGSGQPAGAQGGLAGSLPGFTPNSPGAKMTASGLQGLFGGQGQGGGEQPKFLEAGNVASQPMVSGPGMMMGAGGQNTFGQRAAEQAMAQRGFLTGPSLAANTNNPIRSVVPSTVSSTVAPMSIGSATGMGAGLPGTTLNSPSQLQMAMMTGNISPYDIYAGMGGGAQFGSS